MNSINETANQLDRLVGILTACVVNWPDMEVRLNDSIKLYKQILTKPLPGMVEEAIEDLLDLRHYFLDIKKHTDLPLDKPLEIIDWLLGQE